MNYYTWTYEVGQNKWRSNDEKSAQSGATLNSNISSYKQAFDIV